jgi:hypothetical protein
MEDATTMLGGELEGVSSQLADLSEAVSQIATSLQR